MAVLQGIRLIAVWLRSQAAVLGNVLLMPVYIGRYPSYLQRPSLVIGPYCPSTCHCGLAGLIRVLRPQAPPPPLDLTATTRWLDQIQAGSLSACLSSRSPLAEHYLGGDALVTRVLDWARTLKRRDHFIELFTQPDQRDQVSALYDKLTELIESQTQAFAQASGRLDTGDTDIVDQRIEILKDAAWCLKVEILDNISKVQELLGEDNTAIGEKVALFRNINAVLNSIDRLEVRGRDSAGISLLFLLAADTFADLEQQWERSQIAQHISHRSNHPVLDNGAITLHKNDTTGLTAITLAYKVAAEIGSLGDNVAALRAEIAQDPVLHAIADHPHQFHTISAHTRWASVGAITIANCHPVDNAVVQPAATDEGIIHACLNGDIDSYAALKKSWEANYPPIAEDITTDTKIIPLQIQLHLDQGLPIAEAFRAAVNDFEGSHAIAMHTDLAPGKFFLAQKGSGQAVFIGLADDHYLPTSEVYGFVEETQRFLKLNGERVVKGRNGPTQGQIYILDQTAGGGLAGITAMYYDGTPIALDDDDIQTTEITSRDIDRQSFSHYFLKEISEAPNSVARTIQNRWKINVEQPDCRMITLDEKAFPETVSQDLIQGRTRRIFFIGQGTAGIAAQAGADILSYYLNDPALKVSALKASELSGFQLGGQEDSTAMADTLVIAISQSGTTTDTNRTVDMVRARGARTLAVVNRRDSDLTFKVHGVVYTSSGRDIEMSVASTKAFYSQIVACGLLGLNIARVMKKRSPAFISDEIDALIALPEQMRKVLAIKDQIKTTAERFAAAKTYWATVGSGPNKSAADEIRIKLSELCYKTISSDYVEDKKHIDLSSEPLILVCAAGSGGTVIGDIIKDTAIFQRA